MALLGQPNGNLLSSSVAYTDKGSSPADGTSISVAINYIGWVAMIDVYGGNKTVVRVDVGGSASGFVTGITNLYASVTVTFNYSNGASLPVTVTRQGQYSGYNLIFYNTYYNATLSSISVNADAYCEGVWFFGNMSTGWLNLTQTNTIGYCSDQNVIANVLYPAEGKNKHIYLPVNPNVGQSIRIKNVVNTQLFVHAYNKLIEDGANNRIFVSTSIQSITGSECGFIMSGNAACTLLYDGSRWLITEYYSGQRSGYFNVMMSAVSASNIQQAAQSVIIANITSGNKFVQLPNPAGVCRQISLIAYGSSSNLLHFTVGSTSIAKIDNISYSQYNWWGLRPVRGDANAAVTLLSNGTDWFVMSCTDAVNMSLDTSVNSYNLVTQPFVTIGSGDGVCVNQTIIPTSGSAIFYMKHGIVSPYSNGLVIAARDSAYFGGTTNRRTWLDYIRNRSAGSVLGTYINGIPIFFLLSYFSGL